MARRKGKKMKILDRVAYLLLVAGGINWGLVALAGFDLVQFLSFGVGMVETALKVLVGASGVYGLIQFFKLK